MPSSIQPMGNLEARRAGAARHGEQTQEITTELCAYCGFRSNVAVGRSRSLPAFPAPERQKNSNRVSFHPRKHLQDLF
jgi:ribosomal protein L37E